MRRRFLRRTGRQLGRMMTASIPPLLIRSNQFLASGDFIQAADGLEQLARAAEGRGGRRAARLYLEAGRARIMAAQSSHGVELIKSGLSLLAEAGLTPRLALSGSRLIRELKDQGFSQEAEQITIFLRNLAPDFEAERPEPASIRRPPLPTHCPGCGAPIRPDDVEWLDESTAECAYCGSPVRGS
jgi:hypothetical protein